VFCKHEDAVRHLRRRRLDRVELQLVLDHVHDDVPERVHRPAVRRLEAHRHEAVREAVPERARVPLAVVELDRVVVRGEHLVAVEVVGTRAGLLVLHRVAEADDLVVADDVPLALHADPVVVRVPAAVVGVDRGPDEPALEDVVAQVEVALIGIADDPVRHVAHVDAAHDVPLRAGALQRRPRGARPAG
jgi:hypothetical protein